MDKQILTFCRLPRQNLGPFLKKTEKDNLVTRGSIPVSTNYYRDYYEYLNKCPVFNKTGFLTDFGRFRR